MVTIILIIINIAVYFALKKSKILLYDVTVSYESVFKYKRYYKIVAAGFAHSEMSHLICNMLSLYSVGSWAEAYYGSIRYLFIYFIILILGQTISLIAKHNSGQDTSYSLGASGVICGLIGIYFVKLYLYYGLSGIMQIVPSLLPMIIMSLLPGVDKSAHLYGFVVGGIIGLIL